MLGLFIYGSELSSRIRICVHCFGLENSYTACCNVVKEVIKTASS